MAHIIIKSTNEVYHRLDSRLYEVSMKTGKQTRYGLSFISINDIKERGFEIVNEVSENKRYPFGYVGD